MWVLPSRLSLQFRPGKRLPICWKYGLHSKCLTCCLCFSSSMQICTFVYGRWATLRCSVSSLLSLQSICPRLASLSLHHTYPSLLHLTLLLSFYSPLSHVNITGHCLFCQVLKYINRHCWVYCITLTFIISSAASRLIQFLCVFFFLFVHLPSFPLPRVCVQYVVVTVCLKAGMETTAWTRVGTVTHSNIRHHMCCFLLGRLINRGEGVGSPLLWGFHCEGLT